MKTRAQRIRVKTIDQNDLHRTWELAIKHRREVIAQEQRVMDAMRGWPKQEERKG